MWRDRHTATLVFALVRRDLIAHLRRTLLGAAWMVARPLMATAVFYLVFAQVGGLTPHDAPYVLFAISGLVPWQIFSDVVLRTSQSLLDAAPLLQKAAVPHIAFPLAALVHASIFGVAT